MQKARMLRLGPVTWALLFSGFTRVANAASVADLQGLAKFSKELIANGQAACALAAKYLPDQARRDVPTDKAKERQPTI